MDYSLLVIIETNPEWVESQRKRNETKKENNYRAKTNDIIENKNDPNEVVGVEIDEALENLELEFGRKLTTRQSHSKSKF